MVDSANPIAFKFEISVSHSLPIFKAENYANNKIAQQLSVVRSGVPVERIEQDGKVTAHAFSDYRRSDRRLSSRQNSHPDG
jgi:hypothetical protein